MLWPTRGVEASPRYGPGPAHGPAQPSPPGLQRALHRAAHSRSLTFPLSGPNFAFFPWPSAHHLFQPADRAGWGCGACRAQHYMHDSCKTRLHPAAEPLSYIPRYSAGAAPKRCCCWCSWPSWPSWPPDRAALRLAAALATAMKNLALCRTRPWLAGFFMASLPTPTRRPPSGAADCAGRTAALEPH